MYFLLSVFVSVFSLFFVNDSAGRDGNEAPDPNRRLHCKGYTALWFAETVAEAQALLSAGADPNHRARSNCYDDPHAIGRTVLHYHKLPVEIMNVYLEAGADPNMPDSLRRSRPLHMTGGRSPELVEALLNAGADPNALDFNGRTPLHKQKDVGIINVLLEAGADPNIQDNYGGTPLHKQKDIGTIKALLEAGADPNIQDRDGDTPLHVHRNVEVVKALLEAGADPNIQNEREQTAKEKNVIVDGIATTAEMREKRKQNASSERAGVQEQKKSSLGRAEPSHPESSCQYVSKQTQVKAVQCGQRSLCIAEVSCSVSVGLGGSSVKINRNFQVVCSALANGECPSADECASDRSVVRADGRGEGNTAVPRTSSQTSKGVR